MEFISFEDLLSTYQKEHGQRKLTYSKPSTPFDYLVVNKDEEIKYIDY